MFLIVFSLISIACGSEPEERVVRRGPTNDQLTELKSRIEALELFASTYTAGILNEFENCDTVASSLDKKICQIAKTAVGAPLMEAKAQLSAIAKEFQNTLYGSDCTAVSSSTCPASDSLVARIATVETGIANNTASIAVINSEIASMKSLESAMTSRLNVLESRLNNFDGTGSSLEAIVSDIRGDISDLQSDIADITGVLAPSKILNAYLLCGDNSDSGPVFETILISGDKKKAIGTVKTGAWYGTASFFVAGQAETLFTTHLNTKSCNFKFYNKADGTIEACWVPYNRNAPASLIDSTRASGTATCIQ
jgi:uncharacterized coiled-coil protein SlyX